MTIDMKYFNVYYFCQLANESMGKFEYIRTNAEFRENLFIDEIKDFPKISVLRAYCSWLIDRVFYEQAKYISQYGEVVDFNPISWIIQAAKKYYEITVEYKICDKEEDFEDNFTNFVDYLGDEYDDLYWNIIERIATEVEYILFQNREFLLRFNQEIAVSFEENNVKRAYMPEWVKRAILFRDKGRCVFCKKDLTGLYTLLDDGDKQFDHIVSLDEGGINDVCNIQLTCQDCNLKKLNSSSTSSLYQSAY